MKHEIRILKGSRQRVLSTEKDYLVVGRDEGADIRLRDADISRKHAGLRIFEGQVYVRDLGSGNGTFVNGRRLEVGEEILLKDVDQKISIAKIFHLQVIPCLEASAPEISAPQAPAPEAITTAITAEVIDSAKAEAIKKKAIADVELIQEEARREAAAIRSESKQELVTLSEKLSILQAQVKQLEEESDARTASNLQLQASIQEQTEKLSCLQSECSQLELRIQELKGPCASLTEEHQQLQNKIASLSAQRKVSVEELGQLEKDIRSASQKYETLSTDLKSQETALQSCLQSLQETKNSIEQEKALQILEERKHKALIDALSAELKLKQVSLTASIAELDLKRIETERDLQALIDQKTESVRQTELAKKGTLAAQEELSNAQTNLKNFAVEIESEKQKSRTAAQAEIDAETRSRLDDLKREFAERGKTMERELADARLKEMEKILSLQEDERRAFRARRQILLEEIVSKVLSLSKQKPLEESESELRSTVQTLLDGKTVAPSSAQAADRSRRFWKKVAIRASIPAAAAVFFAAFPGIPGFLQESVTRRIASDQEKSGIFLDQIRQHGLKYQPETSRLYRDSYSDNLLYLEDYIEMKLSPDEQKEWTLLLNDFIVGQLGLSDRIIPEFISIESVMLKELFRIREGILPQYKDQGLARLAQAEKQESEKLARLLQTPENYQKFRDLEKGFYDRFIQRKRAEK